MREALIMAYPDIKIVNFPDRHHLNEFAELDYVWLNWYENNNSKNLITFTKIELLKWIKLVILHVKGVKIIYTIHNSIPHEYKYPKLYQFLLREYLRLAKHIVILSDITIEKMNLTTKKAILKKVIKIPHPTYLCEPKIYPKENKTFKVLFFGLLRPYKNIEMLLTLAKTHKNIEFIIAGRPYCESYGDTLTTKATGLDNLCLLLKNLTDDEINELMDESSVLALPYNTKSSLNSGVAIYALSKGLNVIIPCIGTIQELKHKDYVYHYEYNSEEDHIIAFDSALLRSYYEFQSNYDTFIAKAQMLRAEVQETNSVSAISKKIMRLNLSPKTFMSATNVRQSHRNNREGGAIHTIIDSYPSNRFNMPIWHTNYEEYARA